MSAGGIASKAVKWREASSLIILAKNATTSKNNGCDYKALLFSRSEKASFMPKASVFPGGTRDAADESSQWIKHFENFGINKERLTKFILKRNPSIRPQPSIFSNNAADSNCIPKDISLRITAIRETFEEVGIMLCRGRKSVSNDEHSYGAFHSDFDAKHWQHEVHKDPTKFLTLCQELDVVPDLWSLNEWAVWLTPASYKKRFESAFYLVGLRSQPDVHLEENEGIDCMWKSPKESLLGFRNKEFLLQPPQFYEISRLLNFQDLSELIQFSKERAKKSTILTLPVQTKCTNGLVRLYPGDSAYPSNASECTEIIETGLSIEEFRQNAEKLHRAEFLNSHQGAVQMNFQPIDGHKCPLNV